MPKRGNLLFMLTEILGGLFCTFFIRAEGFAVASKLKFYLMGHSPLYCRVGADWEGDGHSDGLKMELYAV